MNHVLDKIENQSEIKKIFHLPNITILNFYSCCGYFRADFEFKVLLGLFHSW